MKKYDHQKMLMLLLNVAACPSHGIPIAAIRTALTKQRRASRFEDEWDDDARWSKTVHIVRDHLLDVIGPNGISIVADPYPSITSLGKEIRTALTAYALRYGFHRTKKQKGVPFGDILIDALVYSLFVRIFYNEDYFIPCARDFAIDWYYGRLKQAAKTDAQGYEATLYEVTRANTFFRNHECNVVVSVLLVDPSDYLEQSPDDCLSDAVAEACEEQGYQPLSHRDFLRIKAQLEVENS